jgi:Flp pilus assembly protein TadB
MKYIVAFGRFWYDFLVGDDWTIAVAVVVAVALTALLSRVTSAAWIVMVVAVAAILPISVWRVARAHRQDV